MDSALKQRLIGAAVLVALAMIFLPMLLQGPDVGEPDAAQVPLSMPAAPDQEFETRELPLAVPQPAGEASVLGGPSTPRSDDPNAVATVDIDGNAAPRVDAPAEEPVEWIHRCARDDLRLHRDHSRGHARDRLGDRRPPARIRRRRVPL